MRQADDPYRIPRWGILSWLLLGLAPVAVAGQDDPGAMRYWSSALPAALALAYAVALRYPGRRVRFLWTLVAGLGALAYLRGGGAALFVFSLPQFWLLTPVVRRSIALSGAGALTTVAGGILRTGEPLTGDTVVTVAAFAASVLLGLSVHRTTARAEDRARRLAEDLEQTRAELAAAHRSQGAAAERDRLAREIHDTLAQGFAAIVALAEAARAGIDADPETSARQLRSIERTARENLAEARALVDGASPAGPSTGSVTLALRRTLDRFAEDTGLAVDADLSDVACERPVRIALLRCLQESLANVRKHAEATTVGVVLAPHPHGLELEITDDGRGFSVASATGFGLDGMRRRLAEFGGGLTVTSSPGDGTRLLVTLPSDTSGST
ncbi:sensor histidine kinase [Actinocorallia libanotica]